MIEEHIHIIFQKKYPAVFFYSRDKKKIILLPHLPFFGDLQEVLLLQLVKVNNVTSISHTLSQFLLDFQHFYCFFFFQVAQTKMVQKVIAGVSQTKLRLQVEVKGIVGTVAVNFPPPPSDRVW